MTSADKLDKNQGQTGNLNIFTNRQLTSTNFRIPFDLRVMTPLV